MFEQKKQKIILFTLPLVFIGLAAAGYFAFFSPIKNLKKQFKAWGIEIAISDDFQITNRSETRESSIILDQLSAAYQESLVKVQRLSNFEEKLARSYLDDKKAQIFSVFEPQRSPYFAVLTTETVCPDKYHPVFEEIDNGSNKVDSFLMYANDRLGFGVCSEDQEKYRLLAIHTYCPQSSSVYTISFYFPKEAHVKDLQNIAHSLKCK